MFDVKLFDAKVAELEEKGRFLSTVPDVTDDMLSWEASMSLETEDVWTFSFDLDQKDKKILAKIMMMPRWEATEWIFPRKKKRGTKRRKRWMER